VSPLSSNILTFSPSDSRSFKQEKESFRRGGEREGDKRSEGILATSVVPSLRREEIYGDEKANGRRVVAWRELTYEFFPGSALLPFFFIKKSPKEMHVILIL